MDKQALHATKQVGFTNEVLGKNPDTKTITPFIRLSKLAKGGWKATYVLEVVYPGGELIYHQTNYTLNS